MYFGSVRFFKHLILTVLALLIVIPTCTAIGLSIHCRQLERDWAAQQGEAVQESQAVFMTQEPLLLPDSLLLPALQPKAEALSYQSLYPDLYTGKRIRYEDGPARVYLTFDDGPASTTVAVLDTLKEYGVKATFFVTYHDSDAAKAVYKRIVEEGHTIAVHTASHDYQKVYASVDSYLADFDQMYRQIETVTGIKPTLFRFPGGSINAYNAQVYREIIAEMTRRGFVYHDWNVSAGDATRKATAESVYQNVVGGVGAHTKSIVLLHDIKASTTTALPWILDTLLNEGYVFDKLDETVRPYQFDYTE